MREGYNQKQRDEVAKKVLSGKYSKRSLSREKGNGPSRSSIKSWVADFVARNPHWTPDYTMPEIPDSDRSVEEIIEAKKTIFAKKKRHADFTKLVDVKVNIDGPISIAHFGDPHLDDDGCDFQLFDHHCEIVSKTEGMFAGNIGDFINNWVGRLTAQHAKQTTTANEAWKLAEWMFRRMPWMYAIGGNHDLWSGDRDPIKWITQQLGQPYTAHGIRIRLNFPNKTSVIINAAHNFPGHSMWNPVHGAAKKAMRWPDDIYVCGHLHHTAVAMLPDPVENKTKWLIRLDSYKVIDDYPKQLGIDESFLAPCINTIINPYAERDTDRIRVELDPERAAQILTMMRKEWMLGRYVKKRRN